MCDMTDLLQIILTLSPQFLSLLAVLLRVYQTHRCLTVDYTVPNNAIQVISKEE